VDAVISAGPEQIEVVVSEASAAAERRVRDRLARDVPVTSGIITMIARDESRRAVARLLKEMP
jgi:hypothetical protein